MTTNNELIEIKTAQEIVLQHSIQANRDDKTINLGCAISSMKEALEAIDKAIVKTVRKGELK